MKTICISGGFDPVHIGHIDLISKASEYGRLIIILNSDEWLKAKKGFALMSWAERAKILLAMENVAEVVKVDDSDGSVCEALKTIRPDYFANGGDRTEQNIPELKLCLDLGIKTLFSVGGEKQASSSKIVMAIVNA